MISRRIAMLAALSGAAAVLAGCASPSGVAKSSVAGGTAHVVLAAAPPEVTVVPADHASGVALDAAVTVSSSVGSLTTVAVTKVGGAALAGQLSTDGRTWTASDGLDPGAQYQVTAVAAGPDGTHTSSMSSFSTLGSVSGRLTTSYTPPDGSVVGVGEPIDLHFNTTVPVAQRAAIVQHLHVVSTPDQAGAWHWFDGADVHYRPAVYWQSGTKVTLNADLHGVNAGNGIWGLAGWSSSFSVGAKHVSLISDVTHQMQVYTNDQLVDTWPVSLGKPGFATLSGTLVVLFKTQRVMMDSCSTFGGAACHPGNVNYYHDYVYWDTAVSTNGFFIHAAPWSEPSQGFTDVSHGCINLSTAHAITFFSYALPGDVVVVSQTSNPADITNGEADWQIPFAQFDNSGGVPAAATAAPAASASPGGP
jgi:lipoprotein-anchoring transpeptidase ErfK/SrfK